MQRHEIIQAILNKYHQPSYLEIGVNAGDTFLNLRAAKKVAVDPNFLFEPSPCNSDGKIEEYHEITSDEYFSYNMQAGTIFDVVYVDGLHTFEQTLRDLLNAIVMLKTSGTIVIDDVLPNSYDASIPDLTEVRSLREIATHVGFPWHTDDSWMGDVYKIPFFIESFLQQFSYATVSENHGQTIMWRQPRNIPRSRLRTVEAISRLEFRHCLSERSVFKIQPFAEILSGLNARPSNF